MHHRQGPDAAESNVTEGDLGRGSIRFVESNPARVAGLCRTMEHGIGGRSPSLGCQAWTGRGVVVRRLSLASLDSGAKSAVYGTAPAVSAEPEGPAVRPPRPGAPYLRVPQHSLPATRVRSQRVGRRPAQRNMVFVGHPCTSAADGSPMTSFASSWDVPRGPRSPGKHSDVHGREG